MKLAVVIPVFNRPNLVIDALNSILSQTVFPWKLIVVDDGSTDNTYDIIMAWQARCNVSFDICLLRQVNSGVSSARNRGAKEANGADLISFLDSDDIWPNNFVEEAINTFSCNKHLSAASAPSMVCTYDSNLTKVSVKNNSMPKRTIKMAAKFLYDSYPGTPSIVVKYSVFNYFNGFPEGVQLGEDAILFLLVSTSGSWGHIDSRPVEIRHFIKSNHAIIHLSDNSSPDAYLVLAEKLEDSAMKYNCSRALRFAIKRRWIKAANIMQKNGRVGGAIECYKKAIKIAPLSLMLRFRYFVLRNFEDIKNG